LSEAAACLDIPLLTMHLNIKNSRISSFQPNLGSISTAALTQPFLAVTPTVSDSVFNTVDTLCATDNDRIGISQNLNIPNAPTKRKHEQQQFGKNGDLMATSDRRINSLNRHILKQFDAALIDAVHPNSIHQIDDIREQLLQSIAVKPIQCDKLKGMKELAETEAVKSLIRMLGHAPSSSDYLRYLSCLAGDFTRFFLCQHFKIKISKYKWSQAHVYMKLFHAGGSNEHWDAARGFHSASYNVDDVDEAFTFMSSIDQISHQATRTHYVTDNKGLLHELPANIRRYNSDESYRLYCIHCTVNAKNHLSFLRFDS